MSDYAGMERRLVVRLLTYWRNLGGGLGHVPEREAELSAQVGEDWDWCFLLDCRRDSYDPSVQFVGEGLIADFRDDPTDLAVSQIDFSTLLGKAAGRHSVAVERKLPVALSGSYGTSYGRDVLYRGVLLPLRDADGSFDYLLGAVSMLVKESHYDA